ncbi:MAG: hypothetical protein JWM53_4200, partial [bacterium]|nr:hypothetical protein [bacterium]
MTSDGNNLFAEDGSGGVERIAAPNAFSTIYGAPFADMQNDGTHLYVATGRVAGGGAVLRMNGDGTSVTTLASENAFSIGVDDRYAYFSLDHTIRRVCK